MKQITVYGLLSKIYNGNISMPKKIRFCEYDYYWDEDFKDYLRKDDEKGYMFSFLDEHSDNLKSFLQDTVDILDDEIETISNKTRYYFSSISNGMMRTDREALDSMFDTIYKKIDELSSTINEMKKGE